MAALAAPASPGEPFFPGVAYSSRLPTPESLLGFPLGERAATAAEIDRALAAWAEASPRARLSEYGRTHEGRPLRLLFVSSPQNLARLDEIRDGWRQVADPRGEPPGRAEELAESLPAVAWLAYSIHGDETSGADAALAVAYRLAAGEDEATARLLDELVVVIDPLMNPDGRDRYLKQLREHGGGPGDRDDQSLYHTGYWPYGRGNHYLFDLNRDWIFATQPETRGRLAAIAPWHPLLFVDAHEMEAFQTYLFYPPREPINPFIPEHVKTWWGAFTRDQAAAFDAYGWPYYTGEWSEDWYPGYSNSWAAYRGAVGILYEQAGVGQGETARPEGVPLTYREAVHHQAVSSLANLGTLARHRREIARAFAAARRQAVAPQGPFAGRSWAFPPGANRGRHERFAELLALQGIELFTLPAETLVEAALDPLGRKRRVTLPAGTLWVPNRQPQAHLAAVLLGLDVRFSDEVLRRERQSLLDRGESQSYDVTAWSLPLLYGLEAYEVAIDLPPGARPYRPAESLSPVAAAPPAAAVAAVIDGADDRSLPVAARLLAAGLEVRLARKAFRLDDHDFARGSLLVTRQDNRRFAGDPMTAASEVAAAAGLEAVAVSTSLSPGDLPDLGGGFYPLLEPPRIALVGRGVDVSPPGAGALWHWMEERLGLTLSQLDEARLDGADLRRYNVLVLPERFGAELPAGLAEPLLRWVEGGGTLIAVGDAATALAGGESLPGVRPLRDAMGELGSFRLRLLREWAAEEDTVDPEAVWSHQPSVEWADPWDEIELPGEEDRDLWERRDRWQRIFAPQGTVLAARVDGDHWLTAGCEAPLPVLVGGPAVLLAGDEAEAPVRLGYAPPGDNGGYTPLGWGLVPTGRAFYLRMSGLLWPEAGQRLANAAYVARVPRGAGQVLLFPYSPVFRGATETTARLLGNALLYGPGAGARQPLSTLPRERDQW